MIRLKIGKRYTVNLSDALVGEVDALGLGRAGAMRLLIGLGLQRLAEGADLAAVAPAVWAAKLAKG